MTLNAVVLPAPLGPISPWISPPSISNETSSRATMPPKWRETLSTASSGTRAILCPIEPVALSSGEDGMEDEGHRRIRVLIADEQTLFVRSLEAVLSYDERVEVVGHAADGQEAVDYTASLEPDVVLMDIAMPVMDGFEATRRIRASGSPASVLVLTGSDSRGDVVRARKAGAYGLVPKGRITHDLVNAIVAAAGRDGP